MYKVLKQTDPTSPPYEEAKSRLQCYSKILKKAIREAKVNYYENIFNNFKGDAMKKGITHWLITIGQFPCCLLSRNCLKRLHMNNYMRIFILTNYYIEANMASDRITLLSSLS